MFLQPELLVLFLLLLQISHSKSGFGFRPSARFVSKTSQPNWASKNSLPTNSDVTKNYMKRKINRMSMSSPHYKGCKIIIAGAPASGKGTQCEIIKKQFGVVHLSTGDILRAAVKDGTELGLKAKGYMDAGKLVPDDLIIGVVQDRLKQPDCQSQGWLLDGFPRTRVQANALEAAGMTPDCFILLDVAEDVLVERVTGRRTDPETGKIYHMKFSPPESEEVAARLIQRSDDTAEKVIIRFRDFQANIDSVRELYEDKMVWVDGSLAPRDVSEVVVSSINSI